MFYTKIKKEQNKTMTNANFLLEQDAVHDEGYLEALGPQSQEVTDLGHTALGINVEAPDEGLAENITVRASRGEGGEESQEGHENGENDEQSPNAPSKTLSGIQT